MGMLFSQRDGERERDASEVQQIKTSNGKGQNVLGEIIMFRTQFYKISLTLWYTND